MQIHLCVRAFLCNFQPKTANSSQTLVFDIIYVMVIVETAMFKKNKKFKNLYLYKHTEIL